MAIFILLIVALVAFVGFRVHIYKKQRQIEEMAADAQAYVSSEIVELLQELKKAQSQGIASPEEIKVIHQQIQNLMENMVCHTDSESSVREYLSGAKQDIAILKVKLDKVLKGEGVSSFTSTQPIDVVADNPFDALK